MSFGSLSYKYGCLFLKILIFPSFYTRVQQNIISTDAIICVIVIEYFLANLLHQNYEGKIYNENYIFMGRIFKSIY